MSFIYFYLLILVHPYISLWWKSFPLAGRQSWEAMVPGYNYYVVFKLGANKPWWSLLLLIPGIHLVMLTVANVSYIRRFGYFSLGDTLQGIFFPYLIMAKISTKGDKILPETNWANGKEVANREWGDHLVLFLALPVIGHAFALGINAVTRHKPGTKTKVKEWGDSILFALIAASIIRTYVFEPFRIPTGSMEKTLLVGDFLFVNKLAYGPKVPVTPLSYPLVHNTVPWVNMKSYTSFEKGEYTRLPGLGKVHRNDVVVFNYPSGDTAVYDPRIPDGLMGHDYHGIVLNESQYLFYTDPDIGFYASKVREAYLDSLRKVGVMDGEILNELVNNKVLPKYFDDFEGWKNKARKMLAEDKIAHQNGQTIETFGVIYRPVDKRENYIKRCVGLPGDWIEIHNSILYVNDKPAYIAENQNLHYFTENFVFPDNKVLKEKYNIEHQTDLSYSNEEMPQANGIYCNLSTVSKLRKDFPEARFTLDLQERSTPDKNDKYTPSQMIQNLQMFPKDPYISNTVSNFSRIQIPKKGATVKLTKENVAWYRRIITAYEGHKLEEKNGVIFVDGKKVNSYTFNMDYYWMMGDNRYNSADSRVWGFVPEDHIVGRASLVWYSSNPYYGVRWERLFKKIN